MTVGVPTTYQVALKNTGTTPNGSAFYAFTDRLPPNVQYNSISIQGGSAVGAAVCNPDANPGTVSGTGLLLDCFIQPTSGSLAAGATITALLNVTPLAGAAGQSVTNRARVDLTGASDFSTINPDACTGTGTPTAGCAKSAAITVVGGTPQLSLAKISPPSGTVGALVSYALKVTNNGTVAVGASLPVLDQLPQYMEFYDIAPSATGTVTPSAASCSATGSAASNPGQALSCTLTLPSGGLAPGASAGFTVRVLAKAGGTTGPNKAAVDPTGGSAVPTPSSCTATGTPAGCAVSPAMSISSAGPTLALRKSVRPNDNGLKGNTPSTYRIAIGNNVTDSQGPAQPHLVFYDVLPVGFDYLGASVVAAGSPSGDPSAPTTTVGANSVSCVPSGNISSGLLLTCTVDLPAMLAVNGNTAVDLQVLPMNSPTAYYTTNKARIDATGFNAPQSSTAVSSGCVATYNPMGCAVTTNLVAPGSQTVLALSKTNPGSLLVGSTSAYTFSLTNSGAVVSGTTLHVYDKLPAQVAFASAAAAPGGSVTPSGVSCSVLSGTTSDGQLLDCVVTLPSGLPVTNGSANFTVSVTPLAAALGTQAVNRAQVDPSGNNAVQAPGSCTANGTPAGCAVTPALTVGSQAQFQLTFTTVGANDTFTINAGTGGNGFTATTLTTTGAVGSPAQGTGSITPQGLNTGNSTVPFSIPAGWAVSTGSCTVTTTQGAAAPGSATLSAASGTGTFSIDATASAAGQVIQCQANLVKLPTLQLSLQRQTGSAPLTFTTQPSSASGNGYAAQSFVTSGASPDPVVGSPSAAQALTAPNALTQLSLSGPAGWTFSRATCVDTNASASGNPAATFDVSVAGGSTLSLSPSQLPAGAALVCTASVVQLGQTVSGLVLQDNGAGGGTPYDGAKNGAEVGRPGVTVILGNCNGVTYATAVTDGEGRFSLNTASAPAGPVCLVETPLAAWVAVSGQVGNTGGSYNAASRTLSFTLAADTSYSGIVLGEVPNSLLITDGRQSIQAGQTAVYGHSFVAGSGGSVVFSTSDQPSQSGSSWNSTLYLDGQCNASLDGADSVLSGPVTVTAGQTVCLLVRVFSPATAQGGSQDQTTLTATETLQPTPQIGPVVRVQTRTDITTVGASASGSLVLVKEVRKVATCPSTGADTLPFTAGNSAMPGNFLEYRLSFTNQASGPVTGIQISDMVPAYTGFQSAGCDALPSGLASCTLTQQPAVGSTGALVWQLSDNTTAPVGLQSGGRGSVVFCVRLLP
ncbi:hypothetical protein PSQ40_13475 [Curvibacter sp. HBC61]|uniref:SpaA-like prealbumin fold domain-containing protein n=1 Tax=Curvibacter cyanobacteriorum TaxID=3026422 RepID=A0ABT5MZZ9_9BURK|nr:hypothetical protein [Curvibacter sp. HBC61]